MRSLIVDPSTDADSDGTVVDYAVSGRPFGPISFSNFTRIHDNKFCVQIDPLIELEEGEIPPDNFEQPVQQGESQQEERQQGESQQEELQQEELQQGELQQEERNQGERQQGYPQGPPPTPDLCQWADQEDECLLTLISHPDDLRPDYDFLSENGQRRVINYDKMKSGRCNKKYLIVTIFKMLLPLTRSFLRYGMILTGRLFKNRKTKKRILMFRRLTFSKVFFIILFKLINRIVDT